MAISFWKNTREDGSVLIFKRFKVSSSSNGPAIEQVNTIRCGLPVMRKSEIIIAVIGHRLGKSEPKKQLLKEVNKVLNDLSFYA